jgi:hypothetical protein
MGTPSAGLLVIFDGVELFAGTAGISHACAALNLIVLPIEFTLVWDLKSLTLFRWLCHLAKFHRIRGLWWGPPCTTFSLARHPPLRNTLVPAGFDVLDEATVLGNLLLSSQSIWQRCSVSTEGCLLVSSLAEGT